MKRLISVCLAFILAISFTACKAENANSVQNGSTNITNSDNTFKALATDINPTVQGMFYRNVVGVDKRSSDPAVKAVDEKSDALLKTIEEYPDTLKAKEGCKTYYISNDGDDKNDGLTPETARATYLSVKTFLQSGDVVLFRRGDLWRGQMHLISGVSYGAYGEGIKPRFYGSVDGSKNGIGEWKTTEYEDVYMFSRVISNYSSIFFNNGEAYGRPVQSFDDISSRKYNVIYKSGKVYLYSPDGNPQDLFEVIEIVEGYDLITASKTTPENPTSDVVIQNLTVMYAGRHGIAPGNSKNIEISGCIIGYMGGLNLYLGGTSIGNGIEFWGNVKNVSCHHNYVFQCFDDGITHQSNSGMKYSVVEEEVSYCDNLIEYCIAGLNSFIPQINTGTSYDATEYFKNYTAEYGNVYLKNNICRYGGYGWGYPDRPDKASTEDIKYRPAMHKGVLVIEGNIFDRAKHGALIFSTYGDKKDLLSFTNNTILQEENRRVMNVVGDKIYAGDATDEYLGKYFSNYSGNTFTVVE